MAGKAPSGQRERGGGRLRVGPRARQPSRLGALRATGAAGNLIDVEPGAGDVDAQATMRARDAPGLSALSAREREIAELVAAGRTNREIAAALFISDKTVRNHLVQVFAKVGVSPDAPGSPASLRAHACT